MGGASAGLSFSARPPTVILMAGLQGSGKTTATAKLARLAAEENTQLGGAGGLRRVPPGRRGAAGEGGRPGRGRRSMSRAPSATRVQIAAWALERAKQDGKDVLIVDTSGRLHVDTS